MNSPFHAKNLQASLTVKDLSKSATWYEQTLGFAVDQRYEREGRLVAVALRAGDVRVLLNQDDGAKGADREKGAGFSLQFTSAQGVDDLATRIKAKGWSLLSEPADMPWGARVFRVADPDGFKLAFSTERKPAA